MKRNKRLVVTDLIKNNDILIKDCDFIGPFKPKSAMQTETLLATKRDGL